MPPDDYDPDANLPVMAKTGAMPTAPALVNAVNELARDKELNTARMNQIREEPSAEQKKATMGALIDLLIDAQNAGDRAKKLRVSKTLWAIWRPFCPADWGEAQMVYTIDGFSSQNAEELPIRRWLQVYAEYNTD
jgi:anti-sigma factor RsiW